MDKSEQNLKIEELKNAMHAHDFEKAVDIAESLEIKKIRDNNFLSLVADAYELTGDYKQAKKILLMAYENTNTGRQLAYRLCLVSVKLKEFDEANEFYQDFIEMAPRDTARYILKYKMAKAKDKPVENLIKILEEYVNIDMEEKWAYELAKLYSIAGENEKCINMCNEISLWFAQGKYVSKAADLKKKYSDTNFGSNDDEKIKENEVSEMEFMDKIIDKTPAKTKTYLWNEGKELSEELKINLENELIDEVISDEIDAFDVDETDDKLNDDKKNISQSIMTHPQEVEEITIPGISDAKPEQEEKSMSDEKISDETNEKLEVDYKNFLEKSENDIIFENESLNTLEIANTNKEVSNEAKDENILNIDDVKDILQQLQARGILAADTVDSAVSIIENVRENKKETKEEKEKNISTLDRWNEDNVEVIPSVATETEKEETNIKSDITHEEKKKEESPKENDENVDDIVLNDEISDIKDSTTEINREEISEENVEYIKEMVEEEVVEEIVSDEEVSDTKDSTTEINLDEISEDKVEFKNIDLELEVPKDIIPELDLEVDLATPIALDMPEAEIYSDLKDDEIVEAEISENEDIRSDENRSEDVVENENIDGAVNDKSTENEKSDDIIIDSIGESDNLDAVQDEQTLSLDSIKDLSVKVEVISGTDWEQPAFDDAEKSDDEEIEEEQEEESLERTSEGELVNIILNNANREIPEPELVVTDEELNVFKNFFNVEGLEDNIQEVVRNLIVGYNPNGKSTDGNVVILTDEKTEKTSLAVEIIKLINKKRGRRNRRLAKIDASALNKRGFRNSLNKLLGSDLIVENAEKLGAMTLSEVVDVSGMFTDDMLIILEGKTEQMEKILRESPRLSPVFNHIIRIKKFDIKEWVEYGKRYANEQGFAMDELASLAFYKAVDDYFGENKKIGKVEVEQLVDNAILKSKKFVRKISGLFSSKKNDEGLYILKESDFIF